MLKNCSTLFLNKRLVVFGSGYIGSRLALYAKNNGADVVALTRNKESAEVLSQQGVPCVIAELDDTRWHTKISGQFDYALNCVGSGSASLQGYEKSYVQGMQSILSWSASHPINSFVYTSSTSVYPQSDASVLDESATTQSVGERGQILLRAESVLRDAAHKNQGINRFFILRLAGIYGPSRHHLLDQVRLGQVSAPVDNYLNLIYRDDAVSAIAACFTAPQVVQSDTFNCSDNTPRIKRDIIDWLCKYLNLPVPLVEEHTDYKRSMGGLNRCISSKRLMDKLNWKPQYDSYQKGYEAILGELSQNFNT
jgi:nucleoside-diphosphate-sugar epimerase